MKILNMIAKFLKDTFSEIVTNIISYRKRNRMVISKNKDTEILDNEASDVNITIKKNEKTKVSGNIWKS